MIEGPMGVTLPLWVIVLVNVSRLDHGGEGEMLGRLDWYPTSGDCVLNPFGVLHPESGVPIRLGGRGTPGA